MKVLVLGGGVIGVTTAYFLLQDGHEVTVVERHEGLADETSFANAGLIAPGHAYTWASPKAPGILLRSLFRPDQALQLRLKADPALWAWGLRFLANCTSEKVAVNTARKVRLCLYSQNLLRQLVRETEVEYDARDGGLLYLYRSPAAFEAAVAKMAILVDNGLPLQAIDPTQAARIDPALTGVRDRLAGAVYAPSDESGDAHLFTRRLGAWCAERGVVFRTGTTIERIETEGDRVTGVAPSAGRLTADSYVLALGCHSVAMARPLAVRLPIYPVKGYSATLPVGAQANAPAVGGLDEERLVAYAPMGERLRVTAIADFAGYDLRHRPADFRGMLNAMRELFPDAADYDRPSYWACLRPMTPEGTPLYGTARHRNLVFNVGHGHMGWTMAAGSGRIAADLVAGRTPGLPLDGMQVR